MPTRKDPEGKLSRAVLAPSGRLVDRRLRIAVADQGGDGAVHLGAGLVAVEFDSPVVVAHHRQDYRAQLLVAQEGLVRPADPDQLSCQGLVTVEVDLSL